MKTVPSVIGDRPGGSTAERIVFDLLRGSKVPGVAFHSLLLSEHEINPTGEADFVVVSPKGLLVIEVKGGTVAREEDGIWSFTGFAGLFPVVLAALFWKRSTRHGVLAPAYILQQLCC